jgi:lipoprotein-anchoring transpeptidase ErfK/SrfK
VSSYRRAGFFALGLLCVSLAPQIEARRHSTKKQPPPNKPSPAQIEAAARLQIFLDRANFSPGKIDGHYNEFTWKALALYRQSRGEPPPQPPPPGAKAEVAPNLKGIDLNSVQPVFIDYRVTPTDLQNVGKLSGSVREQSKLKALLYRDPADAIAEKFHCDVHFLEQLKPGKTHSIKPGDQLRVPNVEPFELGAVKNLTPGSEINGPAANDLPDEPDKTPQAQDSQNPSAPTASSSPIQSVKIDTKTNMLGVFDGDKLVAGYPVTIGSAQTASPIGDWKIRGMSKMPRFRWDEKMLKHGERSGHFYMLPPGPRSPVGVLWIALNKKGIGIHGTATPDTIGHSASHGCVRLANWDVVRLAGRVRVGTPVSIH